MNSAQTDAQRRDGRQREYPNAPARPTRGDRVHVDSDQSTFLSDDVTGTVQRTRKSSADPTETKVWVMYGGRCAVHPFPIEAVTLLEATTPRFDGYEPDGENSGESD